MTSQGWKSLLTPESGALARFRTDPETWPELAFRPAAADSGPARRGGPRPSVDPVGPIRAQLLWAIQYDWQPGDLPLLRFLLGQQILAVENAGGETAAGLDALSRAVRLVARGRDRTDVSQLYKAVHLLITNPVQPDQSWVSYYSELASLQSGANQPNQPADSSDDLLISTAGGVIGPGRPGLRTIRVTDLEDSDIQRGNYSSGIRRGVPHAGPDDAGPETSGIRRGVPHMVPDEAGPESSGIWRGLLRRASSQIPGVDHGDRSRSVAPLDPAAPTASAAPSTLVAASAYASPADHPSPLADAASSQTTSANLPPATPSLFPPVIPPVVPSSAESVPAWASGQGIGLLPDPAQPDPELARFEALRRVARLERQSGHMDEAWRCLGEAQQHLGEHPHWREFGPGQSLATEYFLLAAALDPEEPLARAALKTGDKLTRKLAVLDEYLRQVALRAAEHCADDRLRRRYARQAH